MTMEYLGMNPYLEDPYFWHRFHTAFLVHLSDVLNAVLPAGYVAAAEQRLAILPDDRPRIADLALIEAPAARPHASQRVAAVMERGAPDGIIAALDTEVYERYIEIRIGGRREKRIVTIIELLSPSNKTLGSIGRQEYLLKQQEILHADAHLMEIDLLRFGAHTVAAPLLRLPPRDTWDYIVSLHKWTDRFHFAFWLNQLSGPLPEVRIPLLPDDPDIVVDLQNVFDQVYRAGRYADEIDLSAPLPDGP
jgi:hypothetical protein